jgi:DNA-binding response OmpR family regulator
VNEQTTTRILIVEDEENMATGLKFNLEARGYRAEVALDGEEGYRKAVEGKPDLLVLDLMLPGLDGYEVCKRLKAQFPDLPIIILTARSQESEVVLGLELGADDYVTKPFGVLELMARIQAVLRRSKSPDQLSEYRFGNVTVHFDTYSACKDGRSLDLSAREYEILRHLIEHKGKVVSRDELLNAVWGRDCFSAPRTVDTHIAKLRSKVEDEPHEPKHIVTVHGLGYRFLS